MATYGNHNNPGTDELLARVAWMYYKLAMTQAEIGKQLGLSRIKVQRLLSKARERGIVRIEFVGPSFGCFEVEVMLKVRFSITDAVVVPTLPDEQANKSNIGKAAARYLDRRVTNGHTLGVAWGSTVCEVAKYLVSRKTEGVTVVQLIGGMTYGPDMNNPFDTVHRIAKQLNAREIWMNAPAIVASKELRDAILADPYVNSVMEIARKVDTALVGVGDVTERASLLATPALNKDELREIVRGGAVGDILGRHFDINGQPVLSKLSERLIGLGLEDLKQIRCVIGVAGGGVKVNPLLGALRGGYLDVLITDENTARQVIQLHDLQVGIEASVKEQGRTKQGVLGYVVRGTEKGNY